ncbi:MAG: 4-hydroxyacetophenone monooxygenase, partial [Frankiaceae bacterium]|nr:4-hydroxyacetophenone monooxygenase [Frankiaceae bacterium]
DEEPEGDLRAALADADLPALLMALVQLTGDTGWIDSPAIGPRAGRSSFSNPAHLGDDERNAVLDEAAFALEASLETGVPAIPVPDPELCVRMLAACAGEPVPAEYVTLALEEMGMVDRRVHWRNPPGAERLAAFHVVVIGAGISGLCAAIQLAELGIPFTVIEKNAAVGGTWLENSYPGCRVDVANQFYSYSFERNPDWSEHYCSQPELQAYFASCADKYGVVNRIRFSTEVRSATFDPDGGLWHLQLDGPDGAADDVTANVVITAVGQLNRPKLPDLPGVEAFDGPVFHSAAWRHDVDLRGKRVAVIGTGASSMQLVPTIAPDVSHLTVFQRSPQWAVPNPDYRRPVSNAQRDLLRRIPFYAGWHRFSLLWRLGDGLWPLLKVDREWPDQSRSINAANERVRVALTRYIEAQLDHRPDLIAKALPDYPPYSKRILADNGWFEALLRPNVELATQPIARVHPRAIETTDGTVHEVDAIICGTGFHSTRMLWPMRISSGGRNLAEVWDGDDPRAYLGMAVPGFPNLFLLYGPSTNLGHGGSIIFHSECQTRLALLCIREVLERDAMTIEVTEHAHDDYNRRLDSALDEMIWSNVDVGSWYTNSKRRVVTNSPWRLVDYWAMTAELAEDDWIIDGPTAPPAVAVAVGADHQGEPDAR